MDTGEVCDDGNNLSGDGCSADCLSDETCGNGIVDVAKGEACDDGNNDDGDGCQANCALPTCGDGVVDAGETCDDGNNSDGDGCNSTCTSDESCGNGIVDGAVGEQCDNGLGNSDTVQDACRTDCQPAHCGDGVNDSAEVCDDANTDDCDGCRGDCSAVETGCGDGFVCGAEACDDGNNADCDGCRGNCSAVESGCGDGFLCGTEVCDDGDVQDGDGCSASCDVEIFWYCQGIPSTCIPTGEAWVQVAADTFQMGSPGSESGRYGDEPLHQVTLTGGFEILNREVTQATFELLMGYNPSFFAACGVGCPVEMVSWNESAAFCNALSDHDGLARCYDCTGIPPAVTCDATSVYATPYDCPGWRLPTEAEWEYAARAGTVTATYNGDLDASHLACEQPNPIMDTIAWFCGNSGAATHAVGTLAPNSFELYDALGNVWEWCHDWYDAYPAGPVIDPWGPAVGSSRVFRGGSWSDNSRDVRAARRNGSGTNNRYTTVGFRPARSIP